MPVAPNPSTIFDRAAEEGQRRIDQTLLELTATSFIAGFTIVFGIVALGLTRAALESQTGEIGKVAGALAFGVGLVFLNVGRAELFNENFFDPTADAFKRRDPGALPSILRLWAITFVLNLIGGGLFALVFAVEGMLSTGERDALIHVAEHLADRGAWTTIASAFAGGALVALLSFLLQGADTVVGRMILAYVVGFLLALGPFMHVIVTVLHIFFGILFGGDVTWADLFMVMGLATLGNLLGGVGLVTLTHVAQAKGATEEDSP